jgi:hypothetical protein
LTLSAGQIANRLLQRLEVPGEAMFAITNAAEFFAKVRQDLAVLEENIADSGRAMNCILSTYHLHEWVWAYLLKPTVPKRFGSIMIKDKSSFVAWLEATCPHFALLQEMTNGTKHCAPVHSTRKIAGFGMGPYGIGPYGASYLLIDLGEDIPIPQRWVVASDMLREVVGFWDEFFKQHGLTLSSA